MGLLFALKGRPGEDGDKGDKGDEGDKGDKGDTGDPGFFTSRCSAYLNGDQSIPTGTYRKVQLNAEDYDNLNEFDAVTNYRFQPVANGYYHVSCGIYIVGLSSGKYLNCILYKNGSEVRRNPKTHGVGGLLGEVLSCDLYLLTTDYIELIVWHDQGGNLNLSGQIRRNFMDVHRFA